MKKKYCYFVLLTLVFVALPVFSGDEDEKDPPVFPSFAIINASYRGDLKTIQDILASGVDTDVRDDLGATALHHSMLQHNTTVVKLLLDYGFDPNALTKNGYTPLHFAVAANNLAAARLLLDYGADKRIKDSEGLTPFDKARKSENGQLINLLK
jgi:ankyrin repeat protein